MPVNFFQLDLHKTPPELQVQPVAGREVHPFAQYASKQIALINGSPVSFNTIEDKFNALVAEWRRLREKGSSTDTMINDAYGQIVAMGWPVVPLLLQEVERQSGHWFTALKWITGKNLVKPEMRGDLRAMRNVWLEWGKECKAQLEPREEIGSRHTFQPFPKASVISPVGAHGTTTVLGLPSGISGGGIQTSVTTITGLTA